jgi:hypothetical protein
MDSEWTRGPTTDTELAGTIGLRTSHQEGSMPNPRFAGLYAMVAGAASLIFAPLLALSYFATDDGAGELQTSTVSAWADPARDIAGGLLTWASPERVYATYIQVFAVLFGGLLLCATVVHGQARPGGGLERWGWRLALTGYRVLAVALLVAFVVLIPESDGGGLNVVYLALLVPGMLLSVVGSTVLGIALVRAGYRPRATAWLLALALPLMLTGSDLLGHNSLGLVPLFVAWAVTGHKLWREGGAPAAAAPAASRTAPS